MQFKNKKILITGGTGFIGKRLIDSFLNEEAEIFCLSRNPAISGNKNLKHFQCDLNNLKNEEADNILKEIGRIDFIVFLAASMPFKNKVNEGLIEAKENTLDIFLNFLNVFGSLCDNIIFTSTIDVYGAPNFYNFNEDCRIAPKSAYAIAKACCEKYLEYYAKIHNKRYNILRFSQIYGPGEPEIKVTPVIINALLKGREFILNGGGKDKRRLLYVEDTVLSIKAAMMNLQNDIFNISGKEDVAILDIIKIAEEVSGKELKIKIENPDKEPIDILPSFEKAKEKLGFEPKYNFKEGIKAMLKL